MKHKTEECRIFINSSKTSLKKCSSYVSERDKIKKKITISKRTGQKRSLIHGQKSIFHQPLVRSENISIFQ